MVIYRNGKPIGLTNEECRKIYEELDKEHKRASATITKQAAYKFLDDCEAGDLLAIQNLKIQTPKSSMLYPYLEALMNLNEIMIAMEEDNIEWIMEFNDLYREAMRLLYDKCEQILKEEA